MATLKQVQEQGVRVNEAWSNDDAPPQTQQLPDSQHIRFCSDTAPVQARPTVNLLIWPSSTFSLPPENVNSPHWHYVQILSKLFTFSGQQSSDIMKVTSAGGAEATEEEE